MAAVGRSSVLVVSSVAAVSAGELVLLLVVWAVALMPAVVTALKGHLALFVAGFLLLGLVWLIAAFRLARPNSFWARRFYGPEKLERSQARYPDVDVSAPDRAGFVVAATFGVFGAIVLAGFVAAVAW
jgi:hypothetical protein